MYTGKVLKITVMALFLAGMSSVVNAQSLIKEEIKSSKMPTAGKSFIKASDLQIENFQSRTDKIKWAKLTPEAAATKIGSLLDESQDNASKIAAGLAIIKPAKTVAILTLCNDFHTGLILSNSNIGDKAAGKLAYSVAAAKGSDQALYSILNYMAWRNPARVAKIVNKMDLAQATAMIEYAHPETGSFILKDISVEKTAAILSGVSTDKAAMILGMSDYNSPPLTALTSQKAAEVISQMDPVKTGAIIASSLLSVENAVTILGKAKSIDGAKVTNILAEVDKIDPNKANQIREQIGIPEANSFDIKVADGNMEYKVTSDGENLTTFTSGMTLHTNPYTINLTTGDISYIPYPSANQEDKRVTVTHVGNPAKYEEIVVSMTSTIQNVLSKGGDDLTEAQKTKLNDAMHVVVMFGMRNFYDVDNSGTFEFADVTYMFNNMDKLTVSQGDFNNNGRIDFADVTLLYNKLQGQN